jgi:serine/threonine protein kinase
MLERAAPPKPRAPEPEEVTRVRPLMGGDVLEGRFKILEPLQRTGMSTLFTADDLQTGEKAAVKILAPELCREASFLERFDRETRLMARISHPHLVPLLAVGWRGALPYLVMPLLEGQTLEARLTVHGRLSTEETLAVARQVGHALVALHAEGLVHRDLKPANIFRSPEGKLTLLDLGIAHDGAAPLLTRPGKRVGTPMYMAPEQVTGSTVDARTDVYALGVVLYEALTGEVPFNGADTHEVFRAHQVAEIPDASAIAGHVPRAVGRALQRAMAKDAADRFQTMGDFVARIEMLLEDPETIKNGRLP